MLWLAYRRLGLSSTDLADGLRVAILALIFSAGLGMLAHEIFVRIRARRLARIKGQLEPDVKSGDGNCVVRSVDVDGL